MGTDDVDGPIAILWPPMISPLLSAWRLLVVYKIWLPPRDAFYYTNVSDVAFGISFPPILDVVSDHF